MKAATHTFNTIHGQVTVRLEIFDMDAIEAIDVCELPADRFCSDGCRIDGAVNGVPRGTRFYSGLLGSSYFGEGTEEAARDFLAVAHQDGFFAA